MAKSLHTREAGCLCSMNLQLFMLEHTSPPELLCRNKANENLNGFAQTGRDTCRTAGVIGPGSSCSRVGHIFHIFYILCLTVYHVLRSFILIFTGFADSDSEPDHPSHDEDM